MPPKKYDPIEQIDKLNSGADAIAAMNAAKADEARSAFDKYEEWQLQSLAKLGIANPTDEVAADNMELIQALARIKAAGAPNPVRLVEKVITPVANYRVVTYSFIHKLTPSIRVVATEFNLAVNPDVVIGELKIAGIIA